MLSSTANTTHQDPFAETADASVAAEDAHSLAASAPSAAPTSKDHRAARGGSDDRKELIKFQVRSPKRSNGTFRSTTYFPIEVEVLVANDSAFREPVVPEPEYLSGAGVPRLQRNDLSVGQTKVIDRRYSDFVILRDLLAFQYPHLVLPPLQPKSLLSHMETFFNAKDEVSMQRESLQFFLGELCILPEVVFFAPYFAQFCTEGRDAFQAEVRPEMLSVLAKYESKSSVVLCYSKRRSGAAQNTADRIAAKSTSAIRSLVSYFSANGESRYADADRYLYDFDAMGAEESALPPDAQRWLQVARKLVRREAHLKKSAAAFEAYLRAMDAKAKAQLDVRACLHAVGHTFEEEKDAQGFDYILRDAGHFFESAADIESRYIQKKYLNVVFRLECERFYVGSALDAIDHLLGLYTRCVQVSATTDADRRVTERLSAMLREHFDGVYLKYYRVRMQHISEVQLSRDWKTMAVEIDETAKVCLGKSDEDHGESDRAH